MEKVYSINIHHYCIQRLPLKEKNRSSHANKFELSSEPGVNWCPTTKLIKSSFILLWASVWGRFKRLGFFFPDWYMLIRYHQVVLLYLYGAQYHDKTMFPCSPNIDVIHLEGVFKWENGEENKTFQVHVLLCLNAQCSLECLWLCLQGISNVHWLWHSESYATVNK